MKKAQSEYKKFDDITESRILLPLQVLILNNLTKLVLPASKREKVRKRMEARNLTGI
jgi:hypothetical protein